MSVLGQENRETVRRLARESKSMDDLRRLLEIAVNAWERQEALCERAEASISTFLAGSKAKEATCQAN